MNKKLIGIILILISFLMAVTLIFFIFFYNPIKPTPAPVKTEPPKTVVKEEPVIIQTPKPSDHGVTATPATDTEKREEDSRQIAIGFVQRYGTYSNQADLSRLSDLKLFTTSTYLNKLNQQISASNDNYAVYSGFRSRVITANNIVAEDNRSVYMITVQRTEMNAEGSTKEYRQDIKVELVRAGGSWKVDDAKWQ